MKKCYEITIKGKVQGVGFRYSALTIAHEYGVYGFVKNRTDNSVYIEAEGEPEEIESFLNWCKKGPARARVDDMTIIECPINNYHNFVIR